MAKPTYDELAELVVVQAELIKSLTAEVKVLRAEVAELRRRLDADSSNSSRPPSSDSPFTKKPAKARSSRSLSDQPDQVVNIDPTSCVGCSASLTATAARMVDRRQIIDLPPVPAPVVTEYRLGAKTCRCCGTETTAQWTDNTDLNTDVLSTPGSPVRIGPAALAMCAYLTCAHYLPVGRATALLQTLTGLHLATGFTARARRRAAHKLITTFGPHLQQLLAAAPVLHADETTGRADRSLSYVHVACTEYLTLMHVGGRSGRDIDNGGVLKTFTGVLVRDGYAGYEHLPALHAWCGAHLIRDLRALSDADPTGQLWVTAVADTLTGAHRAAGQARQAGLDRIDEATLATLLNHYLGALAKGRTDNLGDTSELATKARTLIRRFHRYQDMILRFTTDLAVPWTNNQAERDLRPVKIQQRTSGGCWRTLAGLTEFATVHSYLSTATKWGKKNSKPSTNCSPPGRGYPQPSRQLNSYLPRCVTVRIIWPVTFTVSGRTADHVFEAVQSPEGSELQRYA